MINKIKTLSIKDIAEACGVSTATVSRALTGKDNVSKSKKQEILTTAKKLGYVIDNNAQTLKRGKSNTIGIIISDIENYFYNLVLKNLIIDFEKYGYRVLISYSFENSDIERENLISLLSSKVDAIIFTPISNKNENIIELMKKRNIPLLQLFRQAYPDVDAICVDDGYGSYLATRHLLDQGLKNILLLTVKLDFTPSRSKGYIKAYREKGLPINEDLIVRFPLGVSITKDLPPMINFDSIDAVIAGTNTFGGEIIQILEQKNISLPLIVFDELAWLKMLNITTIAQPIEEIHMDVIDNIMSKLNNPTYTSSNDGQNIRVKPKIIIRKSSLVNNNSK